MTHIIQGQRGVQPCDDVALRLEQNVDSDLDGYADLSDTELLATALHDAVAAQHAGVLGGPGVEETALERAARRARRRDASALLRTQVTSLSELVRAA